ncbi:MAG TPA: prolipoprotein diacylglyceryl transferase [Clostridiales bacterium]|nr:prolipoprotein diacylglyceryl transferase [Clostridiales bacterium]
MSNLFWISGFEVFGITIKFYGILIALGFIIGLLLVIKYCKQKGLPENMPYDLLLIVFPSAIIGARLNYIIFTPDLDWTFAKVFRIWEGGLMIYGGIVFSVIAIAIYCAVKKINFLSVLDLIAPALILGQAIGRWGNFFNQEAYGSLITNSAFQWFPFGVYIENSHFTTEAQKQLISAYGSLPQGAWFNATFFYESVWCFGGFLLLHYLSKKQCPRGLMAATYLSYYGFERFFVEMLRTDSLYLGSIRVSVFISGVIFFLGTGYLTYLLIKHLKNKKLKIQKQTIEETTTKPDAEKTKSIEQTVENKKD